MKPLKDNCLNAQQAVTALRYAEYTNLSKLVIGINLHPNKEFIFHLLLSIYCSLHDLAYSCYVSVKIILRPNLISHFRRLFEKVLGAIVRNSVGGLIKT